MLILLNGDVPKCFSFKLLKQDEKSRLGKINRECQKMHFDVFDFRTIFKNRGHILLQATIFAACIG